MTELSFAEICRALADAKLPDCDFVVGIAEGGIVPASLVAAKKGCDLRIVRFNYRNDDNVPRHPEPVLLKSVVLPENTNNVLLVDDVAITGRTLNAAKKLFKHQKVTTMVFKGAADYVLFPEISECIRWPWKT